MCWALCCRCHDEIQVMRENLSNKISCLIYKFILDTNLRIISTCKHVISVQEKHVTVWDQSHFKAIFKPIKPGHKKSARSVMPMNSVYKTTLEEGIQKTYTWAFSMRGDTCPEVLRNFPAFLKKPSAISFADFWGSSWTSFVSPVSQSSISKLVEPSLYLQKISNSCVYESIPSNLKQHAISCMSVHQNGQNVSKFYFSASKCNIQGANKSSLF